MAEEAVAAHTQNTEMSEATISPTRRAPTATAVLAQRVLPDAGPKFSRWQDELDDAARGFPGFLGTEVVRSTQGATDEWLVVYRFDSTAHLESWLESKERAALLPEGRALMASPSELRFAGEGYFSDASLSVTHMIAHAVRPGCERDFLALHQRWFEKEIAQPGCMGTQLLKPNPREPHVWTSLVRFDRIENAERWMQSPERQQLLEAYAPLIESYQLRRVTNSFGAWFGSPEAGGGGESWSLRWRQTACVLVALYPIVMLEMLFLAPLLERAGLRSYLAMFVGNVISVVLLTWPVMPFIVRGMHRWLEDPPSRRGIIQGALVLAVGYAIALAVSCNVLG